MRIPIIVSAIVTSAALFGASPGWAQGETSTLIAPPSPVITSGTPPWMEAWLGFGITGDFRGASAGAVVPFSGNSWTDGFRVRGEALVGQYSATSLTSDDVFVHGASLMLGYRATVGRGAVTGYIGANYETHENDDRFATIRGTEVGVKGLLDYYVQITPYVDFYGMASYSTAYDTAVLFTRVGFKVVDTVWVGPETSYFQNEVPYREQRIGAFVRFDQIFAGTGMSLAGGWLNPLSSTSDDGWYASLNFNFQFR
ncbi:MAG TPA: cellulose biosynthesis protein BcsS [Xanthobacteraceae bacterium]|nr:cellulose biosynthesis protein BcsS [Xanthobacteraceae bacterium]